MDYVQAGTMTHSQEPKTVEYSIESVDYWEQDAFLVINGARFYFQFGMKDRKDGEEFPTIMDALWYFSNEVESKYKK